MNEGFLNIDKPPGMTSHDVVSIVRKLLITRSVGHMGTLDPQATGVLPLAIGRATRLISYVEGQSKSYIGELILGRATTTEDVQGEVVIEQDASHVSQEDLRNVLPKFVGVISQVPPMYSAIKVKGKKLYEYARQGIELDLEPRQVEIYSLQLLSFKHEDKVIKASLEIHCSKGTYIRSLCRDIGNSLMLPACMGKLTRIASGPFSITNSITLEKLAVNPISHLIPIADLMSSFPSINLPASEGVRFVRGQRLGGRLEAEEVYAIFCGSVFLGVADVSEGVLSPKKVLAQEGDINWQQT